MWVTCSTCNRLYDDARCWTLCPYGPLEWSLDSYCPQCDTVEELHGPCRHQEVLKPQQSSALPKFRTVVWWTLVIEFVIIVIVLCAIALIR